MEKYICISCGYVFDEEKGAPGGRVAPNFNALLAQGCGWHKSDDDAKREEIAPGTKWADVPEDFVCPSCGAGKDMFED